MYNSHIILYDCLEIIPETDSFFIQIAARVVWDDISAVDISGVDISAVDISAVDISGVDISGVLNHTKKDAPHFTGMRLCII